MVLLHQRCFYKELITSTIRTINNQQSVTQVGNQKCNLSMQVQQLGTTSAQSLKDNSNHLEIFIIFGLTSYPCICSEIP